MQDLLDPKTQEISAMQSAVVEMLRTSRIEEEKKKSLMIILPYLPIGRLKPIYEKFKEEQELLRRKPGITPEQAEEVKQQIKKIKREAWEEAEKQNNPSDDELDKELFSKLSQT